MRTKYLLGLEQAQLIAAACQAEAVAHGWSVSIVIVDDGGIPIWLQRADGAAPISAFMAQAKATTSALGRRSTKEYQDMVDNGRFSLLTAPRLEGMVEGGVPIDWQGQYLGAIGVSGVKSTEDAQIAYAGLAAFKALATI